MGPRRALVTTLLLAAALSGADASAGTVARTSGRLTVTVDDGLAYPGGLFVVDVFSSRGLPGHVVAVLDGRRCPLFPARRGLRALVPVPATMAPGPYTLGVEVRGGRHRRRVPLPVEVAARSYPARRVVIPEVKRGLLQDPRVVRDGRQVQMHLRTVTPVRQWRGPFAPPVSAPPAYSFGAPMLYEGKGGGPVEGATDSVWGEYHRGMDYAVPAGTVVQAPAAGTVLMAAPLPLTGQTLVLDHGQGVVSVFFHLGRVEVRPGQLVEGRSPVAVSGDTGLAVEPHVHWAVYVHGVAVDPRVMERLID
jgi:murein DD-endopeptidase MepM/ murein hydrolase activator NlpD